MVSDFDVLLILNSQENEIEQSHSECHCQNEPDVSGHNNEHLNIHKNSAYEHNASVEEVETLVHLDLCFLLTLLSLFSKRIVRVITNKILDI